MDESQISALGSKMRDAYADVAKEAAVLPEATSRHPSRRLRKSRVFARTPRRKAASTPISAVGSLVSSHPIASLLIAASLGYAISRLR